MTLTDPLKGKTVEAIAQAIIELFNLIAVPILTIMVVYGGFQIMSAGGDEGKIRDGKKTLLYGAIGFAIVLLANTIIQVVREVIGA